MWYQRAQELTALAMIGEGVLGMIRPRSHLHLWNFGPAGYRKMIDAMEEHPEAMRLAFAAELGVGLLWGLGLVGACGCHRNSDRMAAKNQAPAMNEQPMETAGVV